MNPALLAALINQIAIPELTNWLRSLHAQNAAVTDAIILQKLITDTDLGVQIGNAWLTTHPEIPVTSEVPVTPVV
jgi:hypothetical protein